MTPEQRHVVKHLLSNGQPPRVDPGQPAAITSLKTPSAIRAEIELLKGERTRWRDFAARGVVTGESFVMVEKPLVMRIASLERALAGTEPE